MAKAPNMKIGIGADTSDFEKGAKQVKQGLNDLSKTGDQALSALGEAFGVNTGKVGQMVSAIQGLGTRMTECGNTGVAAFGKVLSAIGPIGGAIAGLGISAAIAGFKELQREAEAFKTTVAGANLELATAAYVDTYRQTLRDLGGNVGQSMAEAQSSWKKFWGEFRSVVSDAFTGGAFINPLGAAQNAGRYGEAAKNAEKAESLTRQIYELERRRKDQSVELAKLNGDIADKMLIARDASKTTAERQDAVNKIELMLSQKRAMTVGIEERLSALYKERSSLATDSVEAADATLAQEVRAYETARAITQEETFLLRVKQSIGKASDEDLKRMDELVKKNKELKAAIEETQKKWAGMTSVGAPETPAFPGVAGPKLSILPQRQDVEYFKDTFQAYLGDWEIAIGFKADTKKIHDLTNQVTSLMESSVARTGELIGNLIGTLAGGGDAWGDFKSAALAAFGDMAIAVGKIAISMGVAAAGIDVALKDTGQWYIAVAAGAALVALGSAVKASLSSVANGDYSASGGGYSSGYGSSSSGGDWETRDVQVNVNGTLKADGDQLIAVINSTNNKQYYTQ